MSTHEGFQPGAAPLCVFCSKPWTETMINLEANSGGGGCETCGYGGEGNYRLEICCEHCKRLIYVKEGLVY